MSDVEPDRYLTEADVIARWSAQIKPREIRKARREGRIAYYDFPAGPCYLAEQVQDYIDRTYLRAAACPAADRPAVPIAPTPESASPSADTISTSPTPSAAAPGTLAGMTPELARYAAEALSQRILNRPRSPSRPSSPTRRPRQARSKPSLTLIKS